MISDEFLKPEIRSGFQIEEMMKRAWATELTVLSEIDRICEKYRITYHANYGTLLGAARHGGFVPWDDDMDISMKRPDYMKFLSVAGSELPEPMRVQSIQTKKDHYGPIGAVVNRVKVDLGTDEDRAVTERYFGCPYVVGVDVYPLDYIPRDPDDAGLQKVLYESVYDAAYRYEELKTSGELPAILAELERLTGASLPQDGELRHRLWVLSEQIAMLYQEEESDSLIWMPDRIFQDTYDMRRDKTWYDDVERIPFEMMTVPVPKGYRKLLELLYNDYMEPVQNVSAHEYPFYRKQEEARQEFFRRKG